MEPQEPNTEKDASPEDQRESSSTTQAEKRVAEHKAIVERMWPNGAPKPRDGS